MLLILRTAACSLVLVASLGVNLPAQDTPQATTPVTDNLDRQFDEGSKIGKISLDEQTIEAIDLLGRVWGFVKYHHPAVARGEYNWDYELFRVMPMYLAADSKRERSAVLVKWIEGLGTFKGRPEDSTKSDLEYVLRPDVQWIDGLESKELTELLTALQRAERPEENRYVELNTRAGNPKLNEESYQQFDYPDTGFRILALYRYWNIVQYYFPYRHLTDKDWNDVLAEFIPKFVNAEDATEYRLAAMELIAAVQDTHAQLLGADQFSMRIRGVNQGNLVLRFIEGKLMVVGHLDAKLAEESEARIGDIVTAVGGVSVENWIEQKARYWGASNDASSRKMIARSILRTNEEQISLTLERAQEILTTVVPCLERAQALKLISSQSKLPEAWKVLDGNIGYLHAGSVQKGFEKALARDLVGKSGLVVDLRCYPSQPIVRTVAMQLVPRRTVFYRVTGAVSGEPGAFAFIPHGYVGSFKILYFPGKVAILVDERTQSSAEYAAMGLRVAPKANVFGSMTAGADGNVSRFTLPGNLRTQVSGIGVYTPERKDTQRVGIIPDVRVEPTIAGVRAGRDKVLESALEWIRSEEE